MLKHRKKTLALLLILLLVSSAIAYYLITFVARPSVIGILEVEGHYSLRTRLTYTHRQ